MYVPKLIAPQERAHVLAGMREHAFASIDGEPFATHAPVRVDELVAGTMRIEGPVATANPHARSLDGTRTMVVCHGPHTCVSPSLYASNGRVPTWNCIAVHATDVARTIVDVDAKRQLLTRLIDAHEPSFNPRFEGFDDRHRHALLNAITGVYADKGHGFSNEADNIDFDRVDALLAKHRSSGSTVAAAPTAVTPQ